MSSVGRPRKSLSGFAEALDGGGGAESARAALMPAASSALIECESWKNECGRPWAMDRKMAT